MAALYFSVGCFDELCWILHLVQNYFLLCLVQVVRVDLLLFFMTGELLVQESFFESYEVQLVFSKLLQFFVLYIGLPYFFEMLAHPLIN